MNTKTKQEIELFMASMWQGVSISVREYKESVNIELEGDSSVGISFDRLLKMVEFFGTKEIDIDNSFSRGGCDTCSYGDSHTLEFTVKPEQSR